MSRTCDPCEGHWGTLHSPQSNPDPLLRLTLRSLNTEPGLHTNICSRIPTQLTRVYWPFSCECLFIYRWWHTAFMRPGHTKSNVRRPPGCDCWHWQGETQDVIPLIAVLICLSKDPVEDTWRKHLEQPPARWAVGRGRIKIRDLRSSWLWFASLNTRNSVVLEDTEFKSMFRKMMHSLNMTLDKCIILLVFWTLKSVVPYFCM